MLDYNRVVEFEMSGALHCDIEGSAIYKCNP
jgi:hypothetical protein